MQTFFTGFTNTRFIKGPELLEKSSDHSTLVICISTLDTVGSFFEIRKTCVKRPLKIRQNKILMTNGSLMKVESIAVSAILLTCIKG